jgi:hypothetical protein
MAAPKRQDSCPKCYLEQGQDVPIVYNLGSTQPLQCKSGHVFEDREELSNLTRQMLDQKKALAPKAEVPPPVLEETLPPVDETNKIGQSTNPLPTDGVKGMVIPPIDMVRLTSLLGTFRDSSTLFGTVYALTVELGETKELMRRMNDAKTVSKVPVAGAPPKAIGGDIIIQLVIPERWVGPIGDIAEANGMDITRYMNAKVEDGLDNQWYC